MEAQLRDCRRSNAGVLRTRDIWRAALVAVMAVHEPVVSGTGCRCGQPSYPCESVRTLEKENPGIANAVEGFRTMTDERAEGLHRFEHDT